MRVSGKVRSAYWSILAAGCTAICLGELSAFSAVGVVLLLLAVGLVVTAFLVGAFGDRSVGAAVMPFTVALAVLVAFPLLVNAAFWVGRGFEGPDGGGTVVGTPQR